MARRWLSSEERKRQKKEIENRAIYEAWCMIENDFTVREVAKRMRISKSTVHKDLTERLPNVDSQLSNAVRELLNKNKAERSVRGGEATKRKYSLN